MEKACGVSVCIGSIVQKDDLTLHTGFSLLTHRAGHIAQDVEEVAEVVTRQGRGEGVRSSKGRQR